MRIVIDLKKEANPQVVLNQLFSYTQLQDTVGVIMLALYNGQPKVMTLKETLQHYIEFQVEVIRRRTEFDLKKARDREHILEGLKIAQDNIDEVIRIIRSSRDNNESRPRLMERFGLTEVQANAILAMRLGQLSALDREKLEQELADILAKIREYEAILGDVNLVYGIIKEEINIIKAKYSDERRTEIQTISGEVDIEDLIPVEDCVVTFTHYGYIKRQPTDVYKIQKRGGRGVSGMKQREEDFVEEMFISSTHDNVLFLTNKGRMFKLKCYEIPEGSRTSKGANIVNLIPVSGDEKVTAMIKVAEFDPEKYLVMVTKQGIIKRTELQAYKNVRKNGLIAITLNDGDELAGVRLTDGHCELLIATRNGMAIRIDENSARPLSRSARGVRAIRLRDGDEIAGMARLREGATVMTVTDRGQGRRSEISEYKLQSRGGKGKINYKVNDVKGYVCGIKVVDENDDLILISNDGVIIRIRVSDVNVMSRYASGVRVMRLMNEDSRVVTFARAEHDEDEEVAEVEKPTEEEIIEPVEEEDDEEPILEEDDAEANDEE